MSSSPTEHAEAPAGVEIAMPQMGVSVAEGTIVEWLKRPGDWVEADEPVCLATTDKVDVEIPAPSAGRLTRVLVEQDTTVAVGTPLALMDSGASPGEPHPHEGGAENAVAAPYRPAAQEADATDGPDRSGFHSPVVERMAAKHHVDLSEVEGTGIGGRVRKRDVLAHIERGGGGTANGHSPAREERPLHNESPYELAQSEAAPEREPMSQMRRRIAEHMRRSLDTSAHCTTVVEVDLSAVVDARSRLRERMAQRDAPLTYLTFVAQAVTEALQAHPALNASVEAEEIVHHSDVNLGIAVALDPGLVVPVVHRAQRLSLEGLAARIAELAERARGGGLSPDDVRGGTFTITNPGRFGAVLATPIINQPQVAILDLEAVVKRPVVVERDGEDAIAIRPMTNLCMSWDHRALDGVDAARFLGDVKRRLEGWEAER